jgi:hypothetical protein
LVKLQISVCRSFVAGRSIGDPPVSRGILIDLIRKRGYNSNVIRIILEGYADKYLILGLLLLNSRTIYPLHERIKKDLPMILTAAAWEAYCLL